MGTVGGGIHIQPEGGLLTGTGEAQISMVSALEVFQPNPDALYSLEATAHLARVTRRSILIYCRAGLVRPVFQPPYGVMVFTEETIYSVRRIEDLRTTHGLDLAWIRSLFELHQEVDRLRAEVRFAHSTQL